MPDYRRNRIEGGTYFFTLALADRRSDLLVREVATLRASVSRVRKLYPFRIDAWVVLPEHLHAVLDIAQWRR
jgi:putative transposase